MRIEILKSAREDLKEGYYFYDSQQLGLGTYFLESLSSITLYSLKLFSIHHRPCVGGDMTGN
jgi:hypothetical protein